MALLDRGNEPGPCPGAALGLAGKQVEAGEAEAAMAQLQWAMDNPGTEAVAHSAEDLVREAEKLAAIAPNVVNKVPMSLAGLKAAATLEQEKDIRVNVTMVFSADQALLAMKTGAAFVSIVLSRLDNIGSESESLVDDTVTVKENYGFTSEILAASLKTRNHVLSCLRHGADIISVPESLFFEMFHHPLTDQALAEFDEVWRKVIK